MPPAPSNQSVRADANRDTVGSARLRESRPPPHSLHLRLFFVLAAILLVSVTGLVELSIRQHREQSIAALSREATHLARQAVREHEEALAAGDEEVFRTIGEELLRDSRVVFARLHSPAVDPPLSMARSEKASVSLSNLSSDAVRYGPEITRLANGWILTLAIPLENSSTTSGPPNSAATKRDEALALGLDATELQTGLLLAASQARKAQALVAVIALLGSWLSIRAMAVRPFEKIAETLEALEPAGNEIDLPRPTTAEAHRLTRALSTLLTNLDTTATRVRPHRAPTDSTRPHALPSFERPEPEKATPPAADLTPRRTLAAPRSAVRSLEPCRILVVEDNPVNRTVAVGMLESLGCNVTCAEDGLVAFATLEGTHFDLVFMDIQMPRLDGLETTRRIRARELEEGTRPTPIIALTAHFTSDDRLESARAGMQGHISKPFSRDDLAHAIEEWCVPLKESGSGSTTRNEDDPWNES